MSVTSSLVHNQKPRTQIPQGESVQWTRPRGWIDTPVITPTEQKICGIYAVLPNCPNFVSFTISGAYTVDWGDGSATENIASGSTASHSFNYADLSSTTEYLGYRQALITITPQAGQNITSVNWTVRNSSASAAAYSNQWIELRMGTPELTTFSSLQGGSGSVRNNMLINLELISSKMTSFLSLCRNSQNLQQVILNSSSNVTNLETLFADCDNLVNVVFGFTASAANGTFIFSQCKNLKRAPYIRGSVNTMRFTFIGCEALEFIPWFDTSGASDWEGCFNNCISLTELPNLNTSNATSFINTFTDTRNLRNLPPFNTAKVTQWRSAFLRSGVAEAPDWNYANATTMETMFQTSNAVVSVDQLDLGNVTTTSNMFGGCQTLITFPDANTSKVTNANSMFQNAIALTRVGNINLANASLTNTFAGCTSLAWIGATGMNATFTVANCQLSSTALDALYANLSSSGSGKTITVTGNYGTTGDDPTIAQNKGWTVTG